MLFSVNLKHMFITIYCVSAQAGYAERDITNHTNGVNQTAQPLKSN